MERAGIRGHPCGRYPPEQPRPTLTGAIARLNGLGRKRPLVERDQPGLDPQSEQLDRRLRRQLTERGKFGAADPGDRRPAGPGSREAERAAGAVARVRGVLTTGVDATRRLVTSSCRLRAMVFCGFSWSAA